MNSKLTDKFMPVQFPQSAVKLVLVEAFQCRACTPKGKSLRAELLKRKTVSLISRLSESVALPLFYETFVKL